MERGSLSLVGTKPAWHGGGRGAVGFAAADRNRQRPAGAAGASMRRGRRSREDLPILLIGTAPPFGEGGNGSVGSKIIVKASAVEAAGARLSSRDPATSTRV